MLVVRRFPWLGAIVNRLLLRCTGSFIRISMPVSPGAFVYPGAFLKATDPGFRQRLPSQTSRQAHRHQGEVGVGARPKNPHQPSRTPRAKQPRFQAPPVATRPSRLRGEPPSSGSRTFDNPKDPCSAGRLLAPARRGRGRYCTLRARLNFLQLTELSCIFFRPILDRSDGALARGRAALMHIWGVFGPRRGLHLSLFRARRQGHRSRIAGTGYVRHRGLL